MSYLNDQLNEMLESYAKCQCEIRFIKGQVGNRILGLTADMARVDHILRYRFGIEDAFSDLVKDRLTQHIQDEYSQRVRR